MRLAMVEEPAPAVSEALRDIERRQGFVPNSMRVIGRNPALLAAVRALSEATLQPPHLDRRLALLAAHAGSRAVGDLYSSAHSGYILHRDYHEPVEKLRALSPIGAPMPVGTFTAEETAVINLARAAAVIPSRVTNGHFEALKKHFSDLQVLDLVAVISYFGFLNRFNPAVATTPEPEARLMLDLLHLPLEPGSVPDG